MKKRLLSLGLAVLMIFALAAGCSNLHLLGRLAEYKYYNMDAIVARALDLCDKLI